MTAEPRANPDPGGRYTFLLGAVHAAKDAAVVLHAMPDDTVAAIEARRCERLDRAPEAVENQCLKLAVGAVCEALCRLKRI